MLIRPVAETDILTRPEWTNERGLRCDHWRDQHTRALIGEIDGSVVATGLMWTSRVHGDRYWVEIVVDPACRRRGYGSAMFEVLSSARHSDLRFMTRGYVGSEGLAFADALGARTIQVVPPARVRASDRAELATDSRVQLAPSLEVLAQAHVAMYEWTHADWSPVAAAFAGALLEGFAEDVNRDASAVAIGPNGEVLAVSCVWQDEPPLITGETTSRDVADGERLVAACVRASLDALAARGVTGVEFDGHVSDPHLLPTIARLRSTGEWFRLVEIDPVAPSLS